MIHKVEYRCSPHHNTMNSVRGVSVNEGIINILIERQLNPMLGVVWIDHRATTRSKSYLVGISSRSRITCRMRTEHSSERASVMICGDGWHMPLCLKCVIEVYNHEFTVVPLPHRHNSAIVENVLCRDQSCGMMYFGEHPTFLTSLCVFKFLKIALRSSGGFLTHDCALCKVEPLTSLTNSVCWRCLEFTDAMITMYVRVVELCVTRHIPKEVAHHIVVIMLLLFVQVALVPAPTTNRTRNGLARANPWVDNNSI